MSFTFGLAELMGEDHEWWQTGPLLEQQVVVRVLSHQPGTNEVTLDWQDEEPFEDGTNPYWLWVTQADGELAWTSPVYVDWRGE